MDGAADEGPSDTGRYPSFIHDLEGSAPIESENEGIGDFTRYKAQTYRSEQVTERRIRDTLREEFPLNPSSTTLYDHSQIENNPLARAEEQQTQDQTGFFQQDAVSESHYEKASELAPMPEISKSPEGWYFENESLQENQPLNDSPPISPEQRRKFVERHPPTHFEVPQKFKSPRTAPHPFADIPRGNAGIPTSSPPESSSPPTYTSSRPISLPIQAQVDPFNPNMGLKTNPLLPRKTLSLMNQVLKVRHPLPL